ncbi:helix-turn-helix domain-containing protein [Algiphilus sp. W345]|uniref:Helix-turn-helix domain-containing protein n=1 Tax=Banduia mediterranea TaxID=3075609 RepID=A0ABU2WF38_9GAMM|nr:helix-turn-helix domain-containing protein [Algiphilus sp. W345]MDT0496485.1 helix-turn-helix domain-containing protein [Algiphilus sp. W345]
MKIDKPPKAVLADPLKRRVWVIYQLSLRQQCLADVARSANVDRRTLYHVFVRPYPRMEYHVALSVGLKPQELFPERYDEHGIPNGRRRTRIAVSYSHGGKNNPAKGRRNTQSSKAA